MTTFNYDFSETQSLGDFVTLTPGRYIFALAGIKKNVSNSGKPKAVLTLRVVAGNPAYIDGVISQHWPVSGAGAFRFQSLLKALKVKVSDKGKVALEKYIDKEFGATVSLKPGDEPSEDGSIFYFHELSRIADPAQYSDLLEDDDEEDYEDDDEEAEEEEDLDDDEDEEDEDEDEDGEEVVTVEDLAEMDLTELKELAEEWEVSTKPDKGKSKLTSAQMRKRLAALIEESDEADEEEEEDEESDVPTLAEVQEMNLSELKELAADNEIALPKVPKGKKLTAAKLRKVVVAELFEPEDDEDDEEPF